MPSIECGMSERFEYDILFNDLSEDLKLSSWGDYKKNSWTKWIDKRIFVDKAMKRGIDQYSYQAWLNFYFMMFRNSAPKEIHIDGRDSGPINQEALLIPTKAIETWTGKKPLWSVAFCDKGLYEGKRSKSRFAFELNKQYGERFHHLIEREKIINQFGWTGIVERVYLDPDRRLLDEVTIIVPTMQGMVIFIDDLEKTASHQYRNDTALIQMKDPEYLGSLFRSNNKLYELLLGRDNKKFGVTEVEYAHLG